MEYLAALLAELTNDPEIANQIVVPVMGLSFFVVLASIIYLFKNNFNPIRRRLRAIAGIKKQNITSKKNGPSRMKRLSPVFLPKDEKELSKIKTKLIVAGFRQENAAQNFFAIKTILAIVLPAIVLACAPLFPDLSIKDIGMYAMAAIGCGVFLPNFVLEKLLTKRQDIIEKGFPDTLDLMVVCIEAGLGFDLAIKRIAKDMQHSQPIIAEEFSLISAEIRAGVDRVEALRHFSERTGIAEIQGFVALLSQSIKFGTSIGETLRIYAEDFRDKRTQKAEEMAAKLSIKMIFPMVVCFFPCFFVIAAGPIVLKVISALE